MTLGLNCMLVRRRDDLLLIETGMGDKLEGVARDRTFVGNYGKLLGELAGLGVRPEAVTHVVNTHLHGDHCGWNTRREGDHIVPTFPRARYLVQAEEYNLATHTNERTRATYFRENFDALVESGQLELVDGEREIVPGVQFVPTPGHTAGHASVILSSGAQSAIYIGDVAHHEVQVERPVWIAAFDTLPLVALETKKKLFERAVRERSLLICVHNSFPGVGRLTEHDGRRKFVAE
jgi:glyoxylase-like metal-dependent hydrolase (beta-lactamase superfamily II)